MKTNSMSIILEEPSASVCKQFSFTILKFLEERKIPHTILTAIKNSNKKFSSSSTFFDNAQQHAVDAKSQFHLFLWEQRRFVMPSLL